jgi:nucleotide-binding universal stress UspA family protein
MQSGWDNDQEQECENLICTHPGKNATCTPEGDSSSTKTRANTNNNLESYKKVVCLATDPNSTLPTLCEISVVEHLASAVLATPKEGEEGKDIRKTKKEGFEITIEGEDKMRLCQQAGAKSQVSYKVHTGKPVDEIVKLSAEMDPDLIVMASSRTPSLTRTLHGTITRKEIDNVEKPLLIIYNRSCENYVRFYPSYQ